jgi:hypothetical protein
MRFSRRILIVAAATAAMVVSTGAAIAHVNGSIMNMITPTSQSYSGSWPVTVSHSQRSNGMYCLTLAENGRNEG